MRAADLAPTLTSDVQGCVVVSLSAHSTLTTRKSFLAFSVILMRISTFTATTARVSRVYLYDLHPGKPSLVDYKRNKLTEPPRVQIGALLLSNRRPLANAFEFFQGYRSLRVFSSLYDLLRYAVVFVGGKASFPSFESLEYSPCRFRSLRLKAFALATPTTANRAHLTAAVAVTVAVCCKIDYAQIEAQNVFRLQGWRGRNLAGRKQIELTIDYTQIALALLIFQQIELFLSCRKGYKLAAFHSPYADSLMVGQPAEDMQVERDSSQRFELALLDRADLVSIGDFRDASDGYLRAQMEVFADLRVANLLKGDRMKGRCFKGNLRDFIASRVGGFKSVKQKFVLLRSWQEFDFGGQLHGRSMSKGQAKRKAVTDSGKGQTCQSPPVEPGASLLGFSKSDE